MRTLKFTLAYDGTNYAGWQRQANALTIQQVLEDALEPFVPEATRRPSIAGASRTDAGVHALQQVASVRVDVSPPADAIGRAFNVRLPGDIRVLSVEDVDAAFHARFDARGKTYRYRLSTVPVASPFTCRYVWHVPVRCDPDRMREAALAPVGTHDFASFQGRGSRITETVRTMTSVTITSHEDEIWVEIAGDGFLRHMVRTVVGSLVDIGSGLRPVPWLAEVMRACDRRSAGPTAPAKGLTLVEVRY
jgi:tRNA pseudouridine38-40 synthase